MSVIKKMSVTVPLEAAGQREGSRENSGHAKALITNKRGANHTAAGTASQTLVRDPEHANQTL
jgi:hypothetical protein